MLDVVNICSDSRFEQLLVCGTIAPSQTSSLSKACEARFGPMAHFVTADFLAYSTPSPGVCGRGPTNDIWPKRTFISCGSSSTPTFLIQDCKALLVPFAFNVRNLSTVNLLPSNPSRDCMKKGLPAPVSRRAKANKGRAHDKNSDNKYY